MLPLRDDNPTRRTGWVTYLLLLANLGIFLWQSGLPEAGQADLILGWGVVPGRLLATLSPLEWGTLLTSQFLHAGWLHLLSNLLVLWIFGNNVEDRLGHRAFLVFYLACGVVAGLAQVFSAPTSNVPGIGASGAIAGVLAAYLLWFPRARVTVLIPILILPWLVRLPALVVIGLWFLLQLGEGLGQLETGIAASGGVAWWAHIGGFVAGLVLAPLTARAVGAAPARQAVR